jgi:hypothetical protein
VHLELIPATHALHEGDHDAGSRESRDAGRDAAERAKLARLVRLAKADFRGLGPEVYGLLRLAAGESLSKNDPLLREIDLLLEGRCGSVSRREAGGRRTTS